MDPTCVSARGRGRVLAVSLVAALTLIAAAAVMDRLSAPWNVIVALIPVPFFIWMLVLILAISRRIDEFMQKIQLEALVIGFLGTAVTVVVWGQLQRAEVLPSSNMSMVWVVMTVFYVIGTVIAKRRYS